MRPRRAIAGMCLVLTLPFGVAAACSDDDGERDGIEVDERPQTDDSGGTGEQQQTEDSTGNSDDQTGDDGDDTGGIAEP